MAQADWTFLNDGLDIATVDRRPPAPHRPRRARRR